MRGQQSFFQPGSLHCGPHSGILCGRFEPAKAWGPLLGILTWGDEAGLLGVLRISQGDSAVQSELRNTKLGQEERIFREEGDDIGAFVSAMPCVLTGPNGKGS